MPVDPGDRISICLHGALAEQFGERFELGVSTAASGIRALITMVPGFRHALEAGDYTVLRGTLDLGMQLDTVSLHLLLRPGSEVHLLPSGIGGKNAGFAKVIIGVALVASAFAFAPAGAAAFGDIAAGGYAATGGMGATAFLGVSYGQIAMAGALSILGGVTALISPQPKKPYDGSNTQSFLLGGQLNTAAQGVCVPVVYGRMLVGSVTVSSGYYAEAYNAPISAAGASGSSPGITYVAGAMPTGGGGGGKGGGGSGGATGHEDPNTLRSKAIVRIIDVLSEGPIGGLVNGPRSIYFNGTPLMAADGSYNFQGVAWEGRVGLPDQAPVAGNSAAEQTVVLGGSGIEVRAASGPHIEAITQAGANGSTAIRLIVQIPALYQVNSKNGSLTYGRTLAYTFDIQVVGGPWVNVVNEVITGGKCMSPYQRAYRVALPPSTTGWNVRMIRITPDSIVSSMIDQTFWFAYVLITEHAMIYSDTAYMALTFDSESFGSSIPARMYEIYGIQVAVPYNYDPLGRGYSTSGPGTSGGTWDLVTTKPATTDDPCWNSLDLMSNKRYGMGVRAAALEATRADFYVASQYANAIISNGFGGTEPRYTMNVVMASQADAFVAMQSMVSAFRGMIHWGGGRVVITADMPKGIAKVVNQTNVIDGEFTYEGSSLKARHTVYRVTWRDPANLYNPTVEIVEDTDQVATRTDIVADIVAFGCTSRGLAHRLGRWALFTERSATETVSYKAGLYHLDLIPGEIIAQTDPSYFGTRLGGRIAGVSGQSVTLDSQFMPDPAQSYQIYLVTATGTLLLHISAFNNSGPMTILSIAEAMPVVPLPNTEFIILGSSSYPRQFQVLGVAETQRGQFGVTALIHDPTKFDWVEKGTTLQLSTYYTANLPALTVAPMPIVSNVTANAYMIGLGATTRQRVSVSFTPVADIRVVGFQASAAAAAGAGVLALLAGTGSPIDIDDLEPGTYTFSVRSVGRDGRASAWVSSPPVVLSGLSQAPDAVTNLVAVGGTRRVQLSWTPPIQSTVYYYEVWRSSTADGTAPGSGATQLGNAAGGSYTDGDGTHLVPNSTWYYWVRPVNTTGVQGPFAGPASATTTLLVADDLANGILNTAKFATGLTPVTLIPNLSTPGTIDGQIATNMADSRLYRWSQSSHTWMPVVNAGDMTGQLLSSQIANLSAVQITGQLSDSQIAALNGAKLTGVVTASALTAGSVLTTALTVGSGQNVISNSCCTNGVDSWFAVGANAGNVAVQLATYYASSTYWTLSGFGSGALSAPSLLYNTAPGAATGANPSSYAVLQWLPASSRIAVAANTPVEGSGLLGLHRCCGLLQIIFYNAAGTAIGSIASPRYAGKTGASYDDAFSYAWVHGVTPAGTTSMLFQILIWNDQGADIGAITNSVPAGTNCFCFFSKMSLGPSVPNATGPAPWQPGGVTQIGGGMLSTGSITARNIGANAIVAGSIAAGAVTADSIASNSISTDKLVANSVTTAILAAGAVTATQIRAGEIRASLLSSDFQLTQASQIGTAVIGTAQIQDAAISSAKIGYLQVQTANIANLTIGAQHIMGGAISSFATGIGSVTFTVPSTQDGGLAMVTIIAYGDSVVTSNVANQPAVSANTVGLWQGPVTTGTFRGNGQGTVAIILAMYPAVYTYNATSTGGRTPTITATIVLK